MGPCFFDAPLYFAKGNFKDVDRKIRGTFADETAIDESRIPSKQSFYLEPVSFFLSEFWEIWHNSK